MFRISCANILTSIVAIVSIFGPTPIFAADAQRRTIDPLDIPTDVTSSGNALVKQPLPNPEDVQINLPNISASQPEKKNIFQQAADGISKGASSAWNATSNFVSGIFKGDEPCSESADTALRGTDSNIEKTKLDTKQAGTDGKDGAAGKCVVAKCKKNYVPNDSKSGCEQSGGPCPKADIKKVAHATAGELKKGQCIITECAHGYHPSDDGTSCQQAELSEADSKQKVEDLEKNAQAMKDKEQSTANKLLGAASIGATGIGGMNLMEGMAQQNADDAAEEDMKAYLATFVCDYGQGRNIKGGEHDVSLPGGNDLFTIVNEYKALALDLKTRKEALGKQPGIESEIIIEAAETGLYDDVGMGRQSGAYASLSRALTDETGADAQAWAQQKADTASKVKTGAIVAGSGIVAGVVGNLAINSGEKNKNKADEINKKYEGLKQPLAELEQTINSIEETKTNCPADASGTYPNCSCTGNKVYSYNTKSCIACADNKRPNKEGTGCVCNEGFTTDAQDKCVAISSGVTPQCTPSDSNMILDSKTGKCECIKGFFPSPTDRNTCYCPENTYSINQDGHCERNQNQADSIQINEQDLSSDLNAESLFDTGKSNLKPKAYEEIGSFKGLFAKWRDQNPDAKYCIKITGHTDKTGNDAINNPLSRNRANAVKDALIPNIPAENIQATGRGSSACKKPGKQDDCRRVTIQFYHGDCPSNQ